MITFKNLILYLSFQKQQCLFLGNPTCIHMTRSQATATEARPAPLNQTWRDRQILVQLSLMLRISYLSCYCNKSSIRKGGLILAHSSRVLSTMVEKSGWQQPVTLHPWTGVLMLAFFYCNLLEVLPFQLSQPYSDNPSQACPEEASPRRV